jgi:hypothetical protein
LTTRIMPTGETGKSSNMCRMLPDTRRKAADGNRGNFIQRLRKKLPRCIASQNWLQARHPEPKTRDPDQLRVVQPAREKGGSLVEVADVYQVDFNGRHALRVSVSSMTRPADVAECGRRLSSGKGKVVNRDDKGHILREMPPSHLSALAHKFDDVFLDRHFLLLVPNGHWQALHWNNLRHRICVQVYLALSLPQRCRTPSIQCHQGPLFMRHSSLVSSM